ncbi:LOW QUALITY PROTEIN: VRTN-like protein [Mya arenaria]|uniref:Vertnin n=1 Tax=Mya arenaria TaxID=6604 RepID=A0ABY7EV44_MYAAR|nr:LOW QUALITY PROTEIN: VRTN-like protein [Mya arenaria]
MKSGNNSPPATVTTPESETRQAIQPADSTPLTNTISDSIVFWERLMQCQTYKEVQQATLDTVLPPLPSLPEVTFVTHKRVVDNSAVKLLTDEVECMGLLPTNIYGDGNCLPRCGSVLIYGDEEKHLDIRARIIMELVVNEAKYLDDKFLEEGSNVSLGRKNFARQFAITILGGKLTYLAIQRVIQAEVLRLCRSGTYMGIWQVAALSNIIQTDVVSVYPRYGGQTVRNDLNRTFVPFEKVELKKNKVYIMWSNIHGNKPPEEWHPNHFVTLLRMFPDEKKELASVGQEMRELSPIAFMEDSDVLQHQFH